MSTPTKASPPASPVVAAAWFPLMRKVIAGDLLTPDEERMLRSAENTVVATGRGFRPRSGPAPTFGSEGYGYGGLPKGDR